MDCDEVFESRTDLSNLQWICADALRIDRVMGLLNCSSNIDELRLRRIHGDCSGLLDEICRHNTLRIVRINSMLMCGIPKSLYENSTLEEVHLSGCYIEDRLDGRSKSDRLRILDLSDNLIDGDLDRYVVLHCPNLEQLYLNMNRVSGTIYLPEKLQKKYNSDDIAVRLLDRSPYTASHYDD